MGNSNNEIILYILGVFYHLSNRIVRGDDSLVPSVIRSKSFNLSETVKHGSAQDKCYDKIDC